MTTNGPPFDEDRSVFCPECGQYMCLEDCTPEKCNSREYRNGREDICDNFRPRDMGRLDWNVLDFWKLQNERRL